MTGKSNERWTAGVARTPTGALDHAAIEARARQLRRETAGAFLGSLAHWIVRTWARVANLLATKPRTAVSNSPRGGAKRIQ